MPSIIETHASRGIDDSVSETTRQLTYSVIFEFGESFSEDAAYNYVHGTSPIFYKNLIRQQIKVDPRPECANVWDATVTYGRVAKLEPGSGERFSFNTTGGTAHITQSLETVATYGEDPPDCKGAIGVNGDSVEGTDITVAQSTFSLTWVVPAVVMTIAYHTILEELTGTVNDNVFRNRARGSVLFLGATGDGEIGKDCEMTFNFMHSKNAVGLKAGDIENIDKEGFHYLWIRYKDEEAGEELVKVPSSVHVERVYEYGDFSQLGIPV